MIKVLDSSIAKLWRGVTLEPTLILFFVAYEVISFLDINLLLQKSCRFNQTTEPNLSSGCDDEMLGQRYVTSINSWSKLTSFYMAIVLTILASVWSDNHGGERRHMIYIPLVGLLLHGLLGVLNSYFWTWDVYVYATVRTIIEGLSGSKLCVLLGSHLYISSSTSVEDRTMRVGLVVSVHYLSIPIGNGISGYMNVYLGFWKSFAICTVMSMIAVLFGCWKIKASPAQVAERGTLSMLKAISPARVFQSFAVLFKNRPGHRRIILILIKIADALVIFAILVYAIFYSSISH